MNKRKISTKPNLWSLFLQAKAFQYQVRSKPRAITRQMTELVTYPQMINDVGRKVDVTRIDDNYYTFTVSQRRYLGRGTYSVSARAIGTITYDKSLDLTTISGISRLGGQYAVLLVIMTAFVLLSLTLITVTPLYLPVGVLLVAMLILHGAYLHSDKHEVIDELQALLHKIDSEVVASTSQNKTPVIA